MDKIVYYIDTHTGTWGGAEGIVTIEVERGADSAMLSETLLNMSDSQIMDYGNRYGDAIILPPGI